MSEDPEIRTSEEELQERRFPDEDPEFVFGQEPMEEQEEDSGHYIWLDLHSFIFGSLITAAIILAVIAGLHFPGRKKKLVPGADVLTDSATRSKIKEVQGLIQREYLGDIDSEELESYIFYGIVSGLDDPYARYYTPQDFESAQDSNHGSYKGIGCTVSQGADGTFTIAEVYQKSPAMEAGLQSGDQITSVAGYSVMGMDLSDVIAMIKEQEETFELGIYRPSADSDVIISIACGSVEKDTVEYELLDGGIGYIRIIEFDTITVEQFEAAVDDLQDQEVQSLVVDLRDNPGGLLTSVCDILDYLLPKGLMVYTEDRGGARMEYYSDDRHSVDLPVAVLVNASSASASEIFAGAIQDRGVGTVIGTRTYGKGVVQKTFLLSDGSGIKFTVEKYYTPNGTDINGEGISPDIEIEDDQSEGDAILEKAMEVLNQDGTENRLP